MSETNVPPPRRGFTQSISEDRETAYPVVVGLNHSSMSALALRKAADEAAHRSRHLHVIIGGSAQEGLEASGTDDREIHTIASILRNRRVTVAPIEAATPETLLEYCKQVGASLLVVGCDEAASSGDLENPKTAHQLVDEAECDVLIVHTDERHGHH